MLIKIFPFLGWSCSKETLRADFLAGLTVALVLIPQSMAYAQLAGLPVVVGLYASFIPVIIGALWGSSHHLQTGPVAMTSLLTATVLMTLAVPESAEYVALAAVLAVLVGVIRFTIGVFKLTVVVNLISKPVLDGFVHAGVLVIASSQMSKLFGLTMERSSWYLNDLWNLVLQIPKTNLICLTLSVLSIGLLIVLKKWVPKLPASLIVVIFTTGLVYALGLSDPDRVRTPIQIVGEIQRGLPHFSMISFDGAKVLKMLPGALAITLIGFMEMCGVAKAVAAKSRQALDLNQEMIGQGMAAISSGLTGGYSVSGSFSRTALSYVSGARTGLNAVFTGLFVALFLLFMAGSLYFLPKAALGVIIIMAVVKLLDFKRLLLYWKVSRLEGFMALFTFVVTLLFAPNLHFGILAGTAMSILIFLFQTMKPNVSLLGRHEDGTYRDHQQHHLEIDPMMPVIRFDGRLFFANVTYFEDMVLDTYGEFPEAQFLALDCQGINTIDASGAESLNEMVLKLRENGVELLFVGMKHPVREILIRAGLFAEIGAQNFFHRLDTARDYVEQVGE